MSAQPYCKCRLVAGRWMSCCAHHEQQFADLQRLAMNKYEQYRRQAYVPPTEQGVPS